MIAVVIASHEKVLPLIVLGFTITVIVPLIAGLRWGIRVAVPLCLLWGMVGVVVFRASDSTLLDSVSVGFYAFFLPWLTAASLGAAIKYFGRRKHGATG